MKRTILTAVMVAALISSSAMAAVNSSSLAGPTGQGTGLPSHAVQDQINQAWGNSYTSAKSTAGQQVGGWTSAPAAPAAAPAAATPNVAAAAANKAAAPSPVSSSNVVAMTSLNPSFNSTINVPAKTLGNTPVQTPNGVVPANQLPPGTQVAKPYSSAFVSSKHTSNGGRSERGGDHAGGGTGNGAENAQNSRSAGGLADSHVGGGRQGGGFKY